VVTLLLANAVSHAVVRTVAVEVAQALLVEAAATVADLVEAAQAQNQTQQPAENH
jgi:hypothetical protein